MPFSAADTSTWLVATKLHPPLLRAETLRRPGLEAALTQSVSTLPVTLLSAPAGYGKTTMLAALPQLLPDLPLAWVTLDQEDNDPTRFLGLVAAALQRLHPECGRTVWPLLGGGIADTNGLKRAVGALINDILTYLQAPFVLVLDDLHFVTEPAVYVALEYLLDHQPLQMRLAVGTRHDPPLRLARLAARRQLAELRRPDLGFTRDEAAHLLNETLGLSLSPEEILALQERTEGWPAGLCLLALPLGRLGSAADRTQFMAAVSHSERYALEFLADEVLSHLPDDLRRFLMESSVLTEITPSACRAVTGREDAEAVLEGLYRQNLAIASITAQADGEPVYRYHALLVRLLSRQLEREAPEAVVELHRRAARAQKVPGRAIAHYLAAGLWEDAAQVMEQSGMLLLHRGMAETVRTWHNSLPREVRARRPRLAVLMGRCEIHRGDYEAARFHLEQARESFVAEGDAAGEGEALASLITLTMQTDDRAARAVLVERALQLPLSPLGQVAALLGRARLSLGDSRWDECRNDVAAGLAIPHATGNRQADLVGITYMSAPLAAVPGCLEVTERYAAEAGALAPPETAWRLGADELSVWPLLWRGRTEEALARAEGAEALRERLGGYPFVGNDLPLQLAVLYLAQGDQGKACQAVDTLVRRIETAPHFDLAFLLHGAGRSLALLGRYAEARTCYQRLLARCAGLPLRQYLSHHLVGLIALLEGRQAEAAEALAEAARLEAQLVVAWVGGSARLLKARLLLEQGRSQAALAAAAPVLTEWEQAGTPGCTLLDGPAILPLLRYAAQHGNLTAAGMLHLFPQVVPAAPPPVASAAPVAAAAQIEPLTQREIDVLKLIVAGRTNRQIGEELYITEETVKSHVVRILRKLDVTSRTQAAIRARELGY